MTDAMSRRTVNLDISAMIVGAEKAGTSALLASLKKTPGSRRPVDLKAHE